MKPDFKNCTMSLIASIEKKYGYSSKFDSFLDIDEKIKNKKHVFLILLDGMGIDAINKNLSKRSFIKTNVYKTMSTIFPPTTVAVTNAILLNKMPGESGYLAWHQYFKDIDKNVVVFQNVDYYTKEKLNIDVKRDYFNYENFYEKYKNVDTSVIFPSFAKDGCDSFKEEVARMLDIQKSEKETFTYCYWTEPDSTMHLHGCYSRETKKVFRNLDKELKYFSNNIKEDSIAFVIADHGLIDVNTLYLSDYQEINELLVQPISLESRCATFKVKDKEKFKSVFLKTFGNKFELLTKDEFLKSDYFIHSIEKIEEFIFDFVAVAIDKYCFSQKRDPNGFEFKATHAGATEKEFVVPLIIIEK